MYSLQCLHYKNPILTTQTVNSLGFFVKTSWFSIHYAGVVGFEGLRK